MQWLKHDTDATQDAKIKKLLIRHGAVGYAVYFHCLELIAAETSETNLTFELEHDSEIIADNLHIKGTAEKSGIAIVEEIMRMIVRLGLFQESNGRIFCFKLLKRMDLSMTSNPRFRELITEAKKGHDRVMTISCKPSSLPSSKPSNNQEKQQESVFDDKNPPPVPDEPDSIFPEDDEAPAPETTPSPEMTAALALSALLLSEHRKTDPKFLAAKDDRKTASRWAEDVEKLIRIDGRPEAEIREVILWVKTPGNFWLPNIESGKKLREKYPTLLAQMQRERLKASEPKDFEKIEAERRKRTIEKVMQEITKNGR